MREDLAGLAGRATSGEQRRATGPVQIVAGRRAIARSRPMGSYRENGGPASSFGLCRAEQPVHANRFACGFAQPRLGPLPRIADARPEKRKPVDASHEPTGRRASDIAQSARSLGARTVADAGPGSLDLEPGRPAAAGRSPTSNRGRDPVEARPGPAAARQDQAVRRDVSKPATRDRLTDRRDADRDAAGTARRSALRRPRLAQAGDLEEQAAGALCRRR